VTGTTKSAISGIIATLETKFDITEELTLAIRGGTLGDIL